MPSLIPGFRVGRRVACTVSCKKRVSSFFDGQGLGSSNKDIMMKCSTTFTVKTVHRSKMKQIQKINLFPVNNMTRLIFLSRKGSNSTLSRAKSFQKLWVMSFACRFCRLLQEFVYLAYKLTIMTSHLWRMSAKVILQKTLTSLFVFLSNLWSKKLKIPQTFGPIWLKLQYCICIVNELWATLWLLGGVSLEVRQGEATECTGGDWARIWFLAHVTQK